ncbi:uncharacterized protein MONBRDRAFT_19782 [Monosiga brevicollis MX1]|uniref:Exportin-1 n=1 Tax=Monosiga brevicollis TaxID=81824 RepID=A9URC7_MONBE|nr:uncharacterized protein MONBRDRAFT_19782 [Monosiga brevicollis MX1]EDQ91900.1 predicted protein [Monosiga brevicollis MX1]|eukprot:XP_001743186.1 hypothetical protein [Monosiga brevicollis MX1]
MSILDFKAERVDVAVLDQLVEYLYMGIPGSPQQKLAEQILSEFQRHSDAWQRVYQVLQESSSSNTKYFALNILLNKIKSEWKILPQQQTEGMKDFIVNTIIQLSSNFESLEREKLLLSKLNAVLVQIVKQEWPQRWKSFVPDIVGASKTSESLCQNNLQIFELLSEEVFDFSKGRIVQVKAQHLKDALCDEFGAIFELCQFVMEMSNVPSLINQTLATMLRFLNWIPIGYVFSSDLVPLLVTKFLGVPLFRNATMQCLAEIGHPDTLEEIKQKQFSLFQLILEQLMQMLPPGTDVRGAWESSSMEEQAFIRYLALFFTSWLREHGALLEVAGEKLDMLMSALRYLIMMSNIDDKEVFKITLEYWNALASSLYNESAGYRSYRAGSLAVGSDSTRKEMYAPIMSEVRMVMINNMAKPEEVLVVETDDGEVVREHVKDTDTIELYKTMRFTLVYLTHLDCSDTEHLMTRQLSGQASGVNWNRTALNKLCWAIGSISGAMTVEDEKRFLVTVIRDLLNLCEFQTKKDDKAAIAANIMYVVGQYPRFLRAHWKFLKTVVNKLFEFMHEKHEGVQDMACDTFIKIAIKCKSMFVELQMGEVSPFVEEILSKMAVITIDLGAQQVHTFCEAVGHMIAAAPAVTMQTQLIAKLMELPNREWARIIADATQDVSVFEQPATLKSLVNILKANTAACRSIGDPFLTQLAAIYLDMLSVYRTLNNNIHEGVRGVKAVPTSHLKAMRAVRREILRFVSTWIARCCDPAAVMENIIPSLLEAVLGDYQESDPDARDHEVLVSFCTIINRLREAMNPCVMNVFAAIFESTLSMIKDDLEGYPEHRVAFYNLLLAIVQQCFQALGNLSMPQWSEFFYAIMWGIKHPMRNVSDTALKIVKELLEKLEYVPNLEQDFYKAFYTELMTNIFAVATDSAHLSGINYHSAILAQLFEIVEHDKLSFPLNKEDPSMPNRVFLEQWAASLLSSAFPHLQKQQLSVIVDGFFAYDDNLPQFKGHFRDFLVQCKEAVGQDLDSLYLAERQEQLTAARTEKQQRLATIPGMMSAADDMADD